MCFSPDDRVDLVRDCDESPAEEEEEEEEEVERRRRIIREDPPTCALGNGEGAIKEGWMR